MTPDVKRKLAAIMFTDIAGYTALSSKDENRALELLDKQEKILTPIIDEFNGTLHNRIGDGLLFTFSTVTDAIKCGIKIQKETKEVEDLNLRIGIHEGEITLKDGDALGDDVNVASRIDPFAAEGGIVISGKVQQNISSLPEFKTRFISEPLLKGVNQDVKVYCIVSHGLPETDITKVTAKLEKDVKKLWYNQKFIIGIVSLLVIIVGLVFYFTGGNDELAQVKQSTEQVQPDSNSKENHIIYIGSSEKWMDVITKNDLELADFLEKNVNSVMSTLDSKELAVLRLNTESSLLSDFYNQDIEIHVIKNNNDLEFMNNEFNKEYDNDRMIALATFEYFDEPRTIIFASVYSIEIDNKVIQYYLDIVGRELPGWNSNRQNGLTEIKELESVVHEAISRYINATTKNEEPGYVTKVDGDIIYINPGGLILQENMSLTGHNTYNLHDKNEDGFTDRGHDWEIQVKDWERALEYIEKDDSYSDLFIKRIQNMYEDLNKEDLSKIYRGQYYGINNYSLKVSDIIDTIVIAKIVDLNHPWVEIRAGDIINLK